MNFKQKFLTLSIRHQISIVVVILSFLCLFMILALFSLFSSIIVNIQAGKRKEYYNLQYYNLLNSEIEFHTFLLYQYEQYIKAFNNQVYFYGLSLNDLYNTMISFKDKIVKYYKDTTEDDYNYSKNLSIENQILFVHSFSNDAYLDSFVQYLLSITHSSIINQLNATRNCRIPFLGRNLRIINDYVFVHLSRKSLFSINRTRIKEIENISKGNFSNYYEKLNDKYFQKYKYFMNEYKKGELLFMDIIYNNKYDLFENYINETYLRLNYNNNVRAYLDNISYNFHFIDYSTEKTFISDNGNIDKVTFLEENSIINDYLNTIFMSARTVTNFDIIPIFPENNTIMSINLCYSFLYKQMIFINLTIDENVFSQEKLNEIYNKLKKGVSNIGDCILDKKYNFDTGQNAYDILNIKFHKFYSIKNTRETTLFKLSDTLFGDQIFCTKFTFPDYPSMLIFQPNFLTLDQLNLYGFQPLIEIKHYDDVVNNFYNNCQNLIILCLLYLWLIIILYLIYRLKKLFIEVIDPINNLVNVINNLEIKEYNTLKYESDDSINELFKLCNELLLGKYKQKMIHDSEIGGDIAKYENKKINDFNNLKINIKLIEEMIENKNEYNIKGDEIVDFKINQYLKKKRAIANNNNIQFNNNLRQTTKLKNNIMPYTSYDMINNIQSSIKKTRSINQTLNILNKKMSFDINLMKNYENIISLQNQSEEDILELEILLNYKNLYDIIDLVFNYELKDNIFISKNNKLLYESNIHNYNKFHKIRLRRKLTSNKLEVEDNKNKKKIKNEIKNETKSQNNDKLSVNDNEIKDSSKLKKEDFDKSVISAYDTKNMLFIWYEEVKYFKQVEFLQNNHSKELSNLDIVINGAEKKTNKQIINNIRTTNTMNLKKKLVKKITQDNIMNDILKK